jgi:plasmid stability protein
MEPSMTVIELPDDQAAALRAQAATAGLTLEAWLQKLVAPEASEEKALEPSIAHLQRSNPKEWARQFRAWADGHDPALPVLSDAAMSRESIYPDPA